MKRYELPCDKKYLIRCLVGLGLMALLMKVTGGAGFVVAFLVLFTCLSRHDDELLFYTFLMINAVTVTNPALAPKGGVFSLAQRILLLTLAGIMVLRISGSRKSALLGSFLLLFAYLIYMIAPSAAGWCPVVSYLKLFLFSMIYVAYYGVANSVVTSTKIRSRKIRSIFLTFAIYFVIGSFLLIPLGIGQMGGEEARKAIEAGADITSLFRGMTMHAQALGPVISMLGIMIYADMLFSIRRPDLLYLILLLCVPVLVWKTSSRTAMGALFAGIAFATFFFMQARNIKANWKSKVTSAFMLLVAVLSIAVLCVPSARGKATNFILKSSHADRRDMSFEKITLSRRGTWETGMYNFRKSPACGNGFQVSEEMVGREVGLTTLSAPIEKGVWISAMLEEGGVVGMAIFLCFAVVVFSSLMKRKCYQGLCAFFMLLVINLGEFTIFSMSSIGGFLWAMVFVGVVLDAQRMQEDRAKFAFRGYAAPNPPFAQIRIHPRAGGYGR